MRTRDIRKIEKPYQCRDVVFTCSNGWQIEKLPRVDYPIEGFFMGHCLGTKWSGGHYASSTFYSLREPDGTPHVTILVINVDYGAECTGRADHEPKPEYMQLIREWRASAWEAGRGADLDDEYHRDGKLTDVDFRDNDAYKICRDQRYRSKRGL